MKLCKDCKHANIGFMTAVCEHPEVKRDPVWGRASVSCYREREESGKCGPNATRFEEKPAPEPAPDARAIVYAQLDPDLKRGWVARIFGW